LGQEATRTAEIEAARQAKSQALAPDDVSKPEKVLRDFKDKKVLERITAGFNGFRVKIGGMATGGGFALGPEYYRDDLATGRITARGAYQMSFNGWSRMDLQFNFLMKKGHPLWAQFYAVRHNYNSMNYYGPGPDSSKNGRSNYRLEDVAIDGTAGANLLRGKVTLAASGGILRVNVGPGADDRFVSSEQIYSEATTPGITVQPRFFRGGGYVEFDTTDVRTGPRSGSFIGVNFSHYVDREGGAYTFDRVDMDFQQYLPFFNKRRVIALRNRTSSAWAGTGKRVPFYMQPVVGGSDHLRGFRPYRFYDNNSMTWNAEYRWEVFAGMDMALFFDAAHVAPKFKDLNFRDLETSWGFGFRGNARNSVFLRLDVGFSHEGFQVWFKFNDAFFPRRVISSSAQVAQ
jgi:outer membrane protein assembly factor BamA